MICDILTANKTAENKTGDFKKCESVASHISRFGHFTCDVHKSPSDLSLCPDDAEGREEAMEEVMTCMSLRDDSGKIVAEYRKTYMKVGTIK